MSKNAQNRRQLVQKLTKKLAVATPLAVAAFGMSQVATAQAGNCPAGSTLSGGICLATSTYQVPTYSAQPEAQPEATGSAYKPAGEAEATGSAYKAKGEAEATGSAYKAKGEAEATGSAYKAKGEAEATGSAYKAKGEAEAPKN